MSGSGPKKSGRGYGDAYFKVNFGVKKPQGPVSNVSSGAVATSGGTGSQSARRLAVGRSATRGSPGNMASAAAPSGGAGQSSIIKSAVAKPVMPPNPSVRVLAKAETQLATGAVAPSGGAGGWGVH